MNGLRLATAMAAITYALSGPLAAQSEHECLILPNAMVDVASAVGGVVDEVLVAPGDVVEKGQVIARLRSEVEQANVGIAQARADYDRDVVLRQVTRDLAQSKLERQQSLSANNISSRASLEETEAEAQGAEIGVAQAEFERDMARLELVRADALLELRTIRAPLNGVIVEQLLWPGEYASEQDHVVSLAQLDRLTVKTFVPIEVFDDIRAGGFASVQPDAPIGGSYEAQITVIDRVFDAASGTFGVQLELPNDDLALPAGLACRITFGANG